MNWDLISKKFNINNLNYQIFIDIDIIIEFFMKF